MKRERECRGITLIALIVTIIILLILAGVGLNLIAGSEGILRKAEKAIDTHNEAEIKEEIEMLIAEAKMEYFENYDENSKKTFFEYLEEIIQGKNIDMTLKENEDKTISGTYKEYNFYLDSDFVVHIGEKSDIQLSVTILTKGCVSSEIGVEVEVRASSTQGEVTLQHKESDAIAILDDVSSSYKKYIIHKNGTYTFTASDGKSTNTKTIKINSILEEPQIEITNNNTGTSFTINVNNEYSSEVSFVYYLNGIKQGENTSGVYDVNNLEINTSYSVKVAIKYNREELIENEVTITTPGEPDKPEIVLYKSNGQKIEVNVNEYQTLTKQGIIRGEKIELNEQVLLELTNTNSKMLETYYSIDDGETWNLYTDKIKISYPGDGKIQAKQVNKINDLESDIAIYNRNDFDLDSSVYDGDVTTGMRGADVKLTSSLMGSFCYLKIDEEMQGKNIYLKCKSTSATYCNVRLYNIDSEGNESEVFVRKSYDGLITLSEGIGLIKIYIGKNIWLYELQPATE